MYKQFYKYLNDILWWCPFKKLRYIIREYLKKIEDIDKENKEIINYLNIISNKLFFNENNIIVVAVDGGFTDQLRTYLVGKSLEKFYNKKILYDITWYEEDGMDFLKKNKRIFQFKNIFKDIEFNLASEEQIFLSKNNNNINCWVELQEGNSSKVLEYINEKKISYLFGGMALSQKFVIKRDKTKVNVPNIFKILNYEDLKIKFDKYFIPILDEKNKEIYNDIINNKNTVACHIRRTDFIDFRYYVELDLEYYKKAFEIIKNKVDDKIKIFFFSDDLDWVKDNIIPHIENIYDYEIVDVNTNEKGCFDFYLISKCQYQIASNGNFCKTAYEFNEFKDKILITPENIHSMQ